MVRWWRQPSLHFVLIGGLLFVAIDLWPRLDAPAPQEPLRGRVILTRERQDELRRDAARTMGALPTGPQWDALLQQAVDDEILYREARRLALDAEDPRIRHRLIQKMRALNTAPGQTEDDLYQAAMALGLDDDLVIRRLLQEKLRLLLRQQPHGIYVQAQDVRDYIDQHRDRFALPPTVSFSHVFLSQQRPDPRLNAHARELIRRFRLQATQPDAAALHSDAFLLGQRLDAQSKAQLERYFGEDFATAVFECPPQSWCGPIGSPFGLHLIWVDQKTAGDLPPLASIWDSAVQAVSEQQAAYNLNDSLARLRTRYDITVEGSPDRPAAAQPAAGAQ